MNPEKREMLPNVAFAGYTSRFRPPRLDEGFQDIINVDFLVRESAPPRYSLLLFPPSLLPQLRSCHVLTWLWRSQFAGNDEQRKLWSRHWI